MALTELCFAINHSSGIQVWEHTFAPREYLAQHLETRFNKTLVGMVMYSSDTQEIAKPSELLNSVKAYMNVLQTIENYGEFSCQFCPPNFDRLYQCINSEYRYHTSVQQRSSATNAATR